MSQHALSGFCTNLTGGLTRLWCEKCREECLHHGFLCIHCGSQHRAYPVQAMAGKWVTKSITIKRGRPPKANQYAPAWERNNRNADIVKRHGSGQSVSTIATVHKLTAARVRHILKSAGVWKKIECSTLGTGPLEPEKIA